MAEILPSATTVNTATVTLSAAQILAIFASPVTLVGAPGAGVGIVPVVVTYNYTFRTTPYTDGGGNLQLQIGAIGAFGGFASAGFWTNGQSLVTVQACSRSAQNVTAWANTALKVGQSAASPTLGDGTLTVQVVYSLVTLA